MRCIHSLFPFDLSIHPTHSIPNITKPQQNLWVCIKATRLLQIQNTSYQYLHQKHCFLSLSKASSNRSHAFSKRRANRICSQEKICKNKVSLELNSSL